MSIRSRSVLAVLASCALVTACDGLKEALTAHVDVVARAGSQELSVTRLADLLGKSKLGIPTSRENAAIIADMWTGYQQAALAAAHGDSLNDKASIEAAAKPIFNNMRLTQYMNEMSKKFVGDSGNEAAYNQAAGGLLGARHILIGFPSAATPAQKDSVHQRALALRAQVTDANFTDMAKKYSSDPGVAQNNGNYGVFARAEMVPEFSNATAALRPGEISQPVASQYGYHIIQRLPYAQVKAEFGQKYQQASQRVAESTYVAGVDAAANIQVKDNAGSTVRDAMRDAAGHRRDNTTLATFKGGELTVAEFMDWVETMPPQYRIKQQLPTVPDSLLQPFVKSMAEREVLLQKADSAKIVVSDSERAPLFTEFNGLVQRIWEALGVTPASLADSAKSPAERERLAAGRVDAFLDKVMNGEAEPLQLPDPLKKILDMKYESSINSAGLDRAVERAEKVRAAADSARAATQPPSQVPLPGAPGAKQAPTTPPAPAPKKP